MNVMQLTLLLSNYSELNAAIFIDRYELSRYGQSERRKSLNRSVSIYLTNLYLVH
jgi:hypothetical protein